MINILLLLGATLVLVGYWASTAQSQQRSAIRIEEECKPKRRRSRH